MFQFDPEQLRRFSTVDIRAENLDVDGRFAGIQGEQSGRMLYRLRRGLAATAPRNPLIATKSILRAGPLTLLYARDVRGMACDVVGDGLPGLCLILTLAGAVRAHDGDGAAVAHGARGLLLAGRPGPGIATEDGTARLALWIDGSRLERALESRLGEPARDRLVFHPELDWTTSGGQALARLIMHLLAELPDPAGLADDPIGRETFTDLLTHTLLTRLPHSHGERIARNPDAAVPRHIRRAEAFMHAAADQPVTIAEIAAAAGCSASTLHSGFRRFRDTTPLQVLQAVRLERVRAALRAASPHEPTTSIMRRFGFTNVTRFAAAYAKQFGEHPAATRLDRAGDAGRPAPAR